MSSGGQFGKSARRVQTSSGESPCIAAILRPLICPYCLSVSVSKCEISAARLAMPSCHNRVREAGRPSHEGRRQGSVSDDAARSSNRARPLGTLCFRPLGRQQQLMTAMYEGRVG
jgi:hypothetical protein